MGYWSEPLNKPKPAYDTTHCSCVPVVLAVQILKLYLEGSWINIQTHHDALSRLLKLTADTEKLVRWCLRFSEFNFEGVHWIGVKLQAANALTRLLTTRTDEASLEDDVPILTKLETQPEEEKTKMNSKIWHSLPGIEVWETVNPTLPEVSQFADETRKGTPPKSSKFLLNWRMNPL